MTDKRKISRRDLLKMGTAAMGLASVPFASRIAHSEEAPKKKMSENALPQVPRRVLGKTGESIPILLFGGAVKLDPKFDPKLAEAVRFGVNYIDAADCYGGSTCEANVGAFVAKSDIREKIWITSKSDKHDPNGLEETLDRAKRRRG